MNPNDLYHRIKNNTEHLRKKVVCLSFLGEFGWFILSHIRYVHSIQCTHKVVCCARGLECYFPSADEFYYDYYDPVPDRRRSGINAQWYSHGAMKLLCDQLRAKYPQHIIKHATHQMPFTEAQQIRFKIEPKIKRNLQADVVIAPRRRGVSPQRNYPHWRQVVSTLKSYGFTVGAVGSKDNSFDIPVDVNAIDYGDGSATVELLQNCRLFIGTDTGVSHLAAFLDVPMLTFLNPMQRTNLLPRMSAICTKYYAHCNDGWVFPERLVRDAMFYLDQSGR